MDSKDRMTWSNKRTEYFEFSFDDEVSAREMLDYLLAHQKELEIEMPQLHEILFGQYQLYPANPPFVQTRGEYFPKYSVMFEKDFGRNDNQMLWLHFNLEKWKDYQLRNG